MSKSAKKIFSVFQVETSFTKTLKVKNRYGLHARPACLLVQTLQPFQSVVMVSLADESVNAKSILGLLGLAASCGTDLTFTAFGPDAVQAIAAVEKLFNSGFGENYGEPPCGAAA